MKDPTITLNELLLALRYGYYIKHDPIVTDYHYDIIERLADKVSGFREIHGPGSDLASSYPPRIVAIYSSLKTP